MSFIEKKKKRKRWSLTKIKRKSQDTLKVPWLFLFRYYSAPTSSAITIPIVVARSNPRVIKAIEPPLFTSYTKSTINIISIFVNNWMVLHTLRSLYYISSLQFFTVSHLLLHTRSIDHDIREPYRKKEQTL
jgi:hypothetical protein